MSDTSIWLALAGVLLVAEMATGTFYLLMIALGAGAAALAAFMGFGLAIQIVVAGAFGVGGSLLLQKKRAGKQLNRKASDDLLDIGNKVEIAQWDSNGRSHAQYRGANWLAESLDEHPVAGLHEIVNIQGNTLKLKSLKPHA